MDDKVYIKIIVIGIISLIIFLILIFINEIGQFFKGILEWLIRFYMRKGQFDPITVWDWAIVIGAIVFSIIYCILRIGED